MNRETIEQQAKLFLQANEVRCVKCKHEYSVHTYTKCLSCRCRSFSYDPDKVSKELAEFFLDDLEEPMDTKLLGLFADMVETLSGLDMKQFRSMSAQEVTKRCEVYQRQLLLGLLNEYVDMDSEALSYLYHLLRQFIELTEAERAARRKKAEMLSR
jgi:hypothetical protein